MDPFKLIDAQLTKDEIETNKLLVKQDPKTIILGLESITHTMKTVVSSLDDLSELFLENDSLKVKVAVLSAIQRNAEFVPDSASSTIIPRLVVLSYEENDLVSLHAASALSKFSLNRIEKFCLKFLCKPKRTLERRSEEVKATLSTKMPKNTRKAQKKQERKEEENIAEEDDEKKYFIAKYLVDNCECSKLEEAFNSPDGERDYSPVVKLIRFCLSLNRITQSQLRLLESYVKRFKADDVELLVRFSDQGYEELVMNFSDTLLLENKDWLIAKNWQQKIVTKKILSIAEPSSLPESVWNKNSHLLSTTRLVYVLERLYTKPLATALARRGAEVEETLCSLLVKHEIPLKEVLSITRRPGYVGKFVEYTGSSLSEIVNEVHVDELLSIYNSTSCLVETDVVDSLKAVCPIEKLIRRAVKPETLYKDVASIPDRTQGTTEEPLLQNSFTECLAALADRGCLVAYANLYPLSPSSLTPALFLELKKNDYVRVGNLLEELAVENFGLYRECCSLTLSASEKLLFSELFYLAECHKEKSHSNFYREPSSLRITSEHDVFEQLCSTNVNKELLIRTCTYVSQINAELFSRFAMSELLSLYDCDCSGFNKATLFSINDFSTKGFVRQRIGVSIAILSSLKTVIPRGTLSGTIERIILLVEYAARFSLILSETYKEYTTTKTEAETPLDKNALASELTSEERASFIGVMLVGLSRDETVNKQEKEILRLMSLLEEGETPSKELSSVFYNTLSTLLSLNTPVYVNYLIKNSEHFDLSTETHILLLGLPKETKEINYVYLASALRRCRYDSSLADAYLELLGHEELQEVAYEVLKDNSVFDEDRTSSTALHRILNEESSPANPSLWKLLLQSGTEWVRPLAELYLEACLRHIEANNSLEKHATLFVYSSLMFPLTVRSFWKKLSDPQRYSSFHVNRVYDLLIKEELARIKPSVFLRVKVQRSEGVTLKLLYVLEDGGIECVVYVPCDYPKDPLRIQQAAEGNVMRSIDFVKALCNKKCAFENCNVSQLIDYWRLSVERVLNDVEACCICTFTVHDDAKTLPSVKCRRCKSAYHSQCLNKWLYKSNNKSCPTCREKL